MIAQSDEHPSADGAPDIYRPPELIAERPLSTEAICMDGNTQTRALINEEAIFSYLEEMKRPGATAFPPVDVFEDMDGKLWLADGWHRVEAAKRNAQAEIMARIYRGTRLDALMHSANSNHSHGLMRTRADKRRCVEMILAEPAFYNEGNRQIARWCGVGDQLVGNIRGCLEKSQVRDSRTSSSAKRRGKDGKHYPATRKPRTKAQSVPAPIPTTSTEDGVEPTDKPTDTHEHGEEVNSGQQRGLTGLGPERITAQEDPVGTSEDDSRTALAHVGAPTPVPTSEMMGEISNIANEQPEGRSAGGIKLDGLDAEGKQPAASENRRGYHLANGGLVAFGMSDDGVITRAWTQRQLNHIERYNEEAAFELRVGHVAVLEQQKWLIELVRTCNRLFRASEAAGNVRVDNFREVAGQVRAYLELLCMEVGLRRDSM